MSNLHRGQKIECPHCGSNFYLNEL
jgi:DNA-directed RNA polymerase subunit RPC12/RpoP